MCIRDRDIGGNYLDFYARMNGIDTKEAYKQILEQNGYSEEDQQEQERRAKCYSVAQYAFEKRLPEDWLKTDCRITTERDRKTKITYMKIPYMNEDGRELTFRKRYAHKDFRWKYGAGKTMCLYGPVSYTHLDVYKRQIHLKSELTYSVAKNAQNILQAKECINSIKLIIQ